MRRKGAERQQRTTQSLENESYEKDRWGDESSDRRLLYCLDSRALANPK